MFKDLAGAYLIDADEIARQVQGPGGSAYEDILNAFGREILLPDGSINRRRLAEIVFSDNEKRQLLNSIVHPKVRTEEIRLLRAHHADDIVVLMVPLLLENRMQSMVDRVVVVTVDEASRRRRLFERSGMNADEVEKRLAAQMPDDVKVKLANYVIDNSGTLEETRRQVEGVLKRVRAKETRF